MASHTRPLALVTGASSGIDYESATCCAEHGFDLLIPADQPAIHDAAQAFRTLGVAVDAIKADLATLDGVDRLYAATQGRPVEALLANAGHGLGHGFLDQRFDAVRHVIDTNIIGTLYLLPSRSLPPVRSWQRIPMLWCPSVWPHHRVHAALRPAVVVGRRWRQCATWSQTESRGV